MSSQRQAYAVWEITLKCNLACSHCGSRADKARPNELSTPEAFDLVHQLADLGITEVTLIGGEAFLRPDWLHIAEEIGKCGMYCSMTTGGYGISRPLARRMKDAGIRQVSVSIDGLAATHDQLRGRIGAHRFAFETMGHFQAVGLSFGCNTQINRFSAPELPKVYEAIRDVGAQAWQVQLTVPMGNAADHHDMLLQPYELLDVYPMLAYLAERGADEGVAMQPGNNIGYFGPYELLLRGSGKNLSYWSGCQAGLSVLGIEADGTIKGCPSLPTGAYAGGNIRDRTLDDLVHHTEALTFNRRPSPMWGFCGTCEYQDHCRAGCSWTSHVFFERRGNNPYCHHRALVHAATGQEEVLTQAHSAPGQPFDHGGFTIASVPQHTAPRNPWTFTLDKIQWPETWIANDPGLPQRVTEDRTLAIQLYREDQNDGRTAVSVSAGEARP